MGARSDFVHKKTFWAIEELQCHHSHVSQACQQGCCDVVSGGFKQRVRFSWSENPIADLVILMSFRQWKMADAPLAIAAHHEGQFTIESNPGLKQPFLSANISHEMSQIIEILEDLRALAVVSTGRSLGHHREGPSSRQGRRSRVDLSQTDPARTGKGKIVEKLAL